MAYLGRYAHQPVDVLGRMTQRQLNRLVRATSKLLEEEHPKS